MKLLNKFYTVLENANLLHTIGKKAAEVVLPRMEANACGINAPVCAIVRGDFCYNFCDGGVSKNVHDSTSKHEWTDIFGNTHCGGGANPSAVECFIECTYAETVGNC